MPFIIISAIVAILVAILAIQNSMMVDLTLFMWSFRLNLVLVAGTGSAALCDLRSAAGTGLGHYGEDPEPVADAQAQ